VTEGAGGSAVAGTTPVHCTLRVNGLRHELWVEPRRTLLDVLRRDLALTGAKPGCERGDCGACTVHLDGRAVYACLLLAVACEGHEVVTVEGLGRPGALHPVQQAFIDHDAMQCGYCTPGQVMAAAALLAADPHPDAAAVREALSGNICRCGAYQRLVEAVLAAARSMSAAPASVPPAAMAAGGGAGA
jgi:aerobic-type carbon monoxide dehydrogenase small subunit (CoxS/CutS family)